MRILFNFCSSSSNPTSWKGLRVPGIFSRTSDSSIWPLAGYTEWCFGSQPWYPFNPWANIAQGNRCNTYVKFTLRGCWVMGSLPIMSVANWSLCMGWDWFVFGALVLWPTVSASRCLWINQICQNKASLKPFDRFKYIHKWESVSS